MDVQFGKWPVLSSLATVAGLVELVLIGFVLRYTTTLATVSHLQAAAALFRNIAVISAIGACALSLPPLLSRRARVPLSGRIALITFGAVYVLLSALLVVLPTARVRTELVYFVATVAFVFCAFVSLTAVRRGLGARFLSLGAVLFVANLLAIATVTFRALGPSSAGSTMFRASAAMTATAEVAYLVALVLLASLIGHKIRHNARALGIALLVLVTLGGLFAALTHSLSPRDLRIVTYGAFGVELLLVNAVWVYYALFSLVCATGLATALSGGPPVGQLGLGGVLLIVAGFAPSTPVRMCLWTLGVVLIARAAIATSQSQA